jgi:D-3-phosphoglycerate dehydrogenase
MIIITAPVHDFLLQTLTEIGLAFTYLPKLTYRELEEIIQQATGVIVSTNIKIDQKIIDKAIQLKWIGRIGSGMEHIDVVYAKEKNILCISSPEGNRNAVAEHAIGLLLNLMRNIHKSTLEVIDRIWLREENRGFELSGKVVGIIGFGNTGSAFAKILSSFDVKILAYDKYKVDFGNEIVEASTLDEIIEQADIISFHLPLTNETKYYADFDFFKRVKKKPYIINTSRGSVINTSALIDALENGKIIGAALDVLENEKIASYTEAENQQLTTLLNRDNVIVTPHIAGYSHEAHYKMSRILLEKLSII